MIEANPEIGRRTDEEHGVRRLIHRRHTIYDAYVDRAVLIIDLLGAGQVPPAHFDLV